MKFKIILIVIFIIIFTAIVFFYKSNLISKNQPKDLLVKVNQQKLQNSYSSKGKIPDINFKLSSGFTIHVFADNLGNPRDLEFSSNGTLLVSDPLSNTVTALPDINNDGVADNKKIIINSGNKVHGLAFYENKLYVAEVEKIVRYDFNEKDLSVRFEKEILKLPKNNNHNNRTIVFDKLGNLYISVGSTCNVCNENAKDGGSVWITDKNGNNPRVFASGLRNAAFKVVNPVTDELWTTEMGRDRLGDNLPPDEINIVKKDLNYGWPNCYGNKIQDTNFNKNQINPCLDTVAPIYEIPAHSAPLGLGFINSNQFPKEWQNDLLVSYHGSWNRTTPSGYKVVRLNIGNSNVITEEDFLTGFISENAKSGNEALGRPVDLIFDKKGNLYLSDDKAGVIYIIQKK